jgi:hypothetical protein
MYICGKLNQIMKKLLFVLALGGLIASCNNTSSEETTQEADTTAAVMEETPEADGGPEVYGEEITEEGAVSVDEMLVMLEGKDSLNVKVMTTIEEVCQKKGCWMDVELANGETMQVNFKDYGFFVPMDCAGKTAIMEGVVKHETLSVEWLKHKASDAGASEDEIAAITEPQEKYQFTASGVILK